MNFKFIRTHYITLFLTIFLPLFAGCSSTPENAKEATSVSANQAENSAANEDAEGVKIDKFLLSPGDEIQITVFQHHELTRKVKIPPNGRISYPIVGDINVAGKSLRELRKTIVRGLSEYDEPSLVPGDEISIAVYKHKELDRKFLIPPDGYIFLPLAGEVKAEGKTYRELRNTIRKKLEKYIVDPRVVLDITKSVKPKKIVNPEVGIEVVKYSGHKVFVLGEVNRPGVYIADGNIRVIEAILLASGPAKDAQKNNVLLIRNGVNNNNPELMVVNFQKALEEGDISQNILVQPGDIIYMPRSIIGDVKRFFADLSAIINPIIQLEGGYLIGKQIEQMHGDQGAGGGVVGGAGIPVVP